MRCNLLSLGGIVDHQTDAFLKKYNSHCGVKGMLDPQDIIGRLLFLLSDDSRYMTGQKVVMDGGRSTW